MIEQRIGYQLKRAQHALRLATDAALREIKLTTPQYAVLSAIEAMPGLSGAALARHAFVTPQTINEIVTVLLRGGMIERQRHPAHGRIVQLFLTPLGLSVLGKAHAVVAGVEAQMVGQLTDGEQQQLLALLGVCSAALEQGREDG